MVQVAGKVFSGVLRGRSLINIFYPRIEGILGFRPYKGTLDIKLDKNIDIKLYATKFLDHKLIDGPRIVYAYLAPAKLIVINPDRKPYDCWVIRQADGVYDTDVAEVVAKDNLKQTLGIKDGDEVVLELDALPKRKSALKQGLDNIVMGKKK